MEELSNFDIEEIYPLFYIKLIACIDHKDLNNYNLVDGSYILNLGNKHWSALYVLNKQGFYFDSYGIIYPQSVKIFCPNVIYSDDTIQSLNSVLCGYFCLYFLYWMTNKFSINFKKRFNLFRSQFDDNEKRNNKILQSLIKNIISKNY